MAESKSYQEMAEKYLENYGRVDIPHNNMGVGQRHYGGLPYFEIDILHFPRVSI